VRRLILLCLFASVPLLAQTPAEKPGLLPTDVFEIEQAVAAQIAPDGKTIVYVRRFADIKTDGRYSNLWQINVDGSDHRPLTTGHFSDNAPLFSPDGKRLAFVSNRDGAPQIYQLFFDNGQIARISNLQSAPGNLAWAPDGKTLAFTMHVLGSAPKIKDMPAAPKDAKWAEPAKVIDRLVYRFNGRGYLEEGFSQIFVLPIEGGTPRQISSGNFQHDTPLVFAPDGKAILTSVNRRADWDMEPLDTEVWEFNVADGAAKALSARKGPDDAIAISPSGKRLAYVGFDDRYQGYQVRRLYVAARDGSGAKMISGKLDRDVENPTFSPDGGSIFFAYDDEGRTRLAKIGVDGGNVMNLAEDLGSGITSVAVGDGFTLSKNGSAAFTTRRGTSAGEVGYLSSLQGSRAQTLTSLNLDLMSQRRLAPIEEIWVDSRHDQRKVHAWIMKPPGFDPAKKYPLILEIHGGPFAAYGPLFDIEKQVWAARGFVVAYANPRGSTSYGEEFANLIHHAYPGDDFFDLDSVVDAVVAKGYIDAEELYVTGGSGGGVLTCWLIGRTDRYRAAATVYPVINWFSWVLTSDVPAFGAKYWFPGMPWEQTEHYMKRSLFSVFENVKTPTLVITGELDWRTPISESEQYYTALKLKGVDTQLVRVPDEPHGIRVRPSHHMAKILSIVGWFEKYRKPVE
jgi:dipeptidyl aminopeptidase/acylaminoacyl peptidase